MRNLESQTVRVESDLGAVWVDGELGFEEEEYEAILRTTETECVDDTEIPYVTCQQTEFTSDQMCLECKVGMVV